MHPPENDILTTLCKKRETRNMCMFFTGNISESVCMGVRDGD